MRAWCRERERTGDVLAITSGAKRFEDLRCENVLSQSWIGWPTAEGGSWRRGDSQRERGVVVAERRSGECDSKKAPFERLKLAASCSGTATGALTRMAGRKLVLNWRLRAGGCAKLGPECSVAYPWCILGPDTARCALRNATEVAILRFTINQDSAGIRAHDWL